MSKVEWKKLGEIGDVCMCKRIMKNQTFDKGEVPFYKIGTFGGNADAFINKDLFLEYKSKFSFPQKGDILLSASGTIGRTVVYDGEDAYFQDSNIVWISNNETWVTNAFLYYCYQIVDWKIDGGTIKRLYNYNLKNTIIPVPSISEQNRIVGILDTFTSSIENLKEQIALRRKQYEYYRDQLLDLEGKEGVEMKTLGEICTKITDGSHFSPQPVEQGYYMPSVKDMRSNGFDFSSCKQISKVDYENLVNNGCKPRINDVLVAKDGSMLKYVFPVIKEENIVVLSSIAILSPKHELINSKYLSYYLMQQKIKDKTIREFSSKGGVPRIILKNFKKFIVEYPSLSEQRRIVGILDVFEASIQNLEAQLAGREKQYDYYRNKLLTFE